MSDELAWIADRPGWELVDQVATYRPEAGAWCAHIRPAKVAARSYERWHVSIVECARDLCRYALKASTVAEATRVTEGHVRGLNLRMP